MHSEHKLELSNVALAYPSKTLGIKSRILAQKIAFPKSVPSLESINLKISSGDSLGLIGLNGAGKTSLLRILAGIIPPTSGSRVAHGSIGTLLGDGIGFEMEMSGWDNIESRLIIQGYSRSEAQEIRKSVVEFADIGDAIYRPMKTYSAGMIVRVGFATSTAQKPDILLVDEVIGAGDITFEQKSQNRLASFLKSPSILVLATHNLDAMLRYCTKVVWLEHGEIFKVGQADELINEYRDKYLN
jgi:ABC-type polysaccharide/polyol phosphate transport system ATPase subunit